MYLDHAATTPMDPRVRDAVVEEMTRTGNPSSVHAAGRAARRVVEESRELVAHALGVDPVEVVFTGGGTEADNLALKGVLLAGAGAVPRRQRLLVSAVEHPAVLDPALWLAERSGASVVHLPVDRTGRLDLDALGAELHVRGHEAALVSVMWANNEVGTVQPVDRVVDLAHAAGVPVHADAVQAVGAVPVDLHDVPVDLLTVSGHKLGGPMGVGALVVRRDVALAPVLHGGGQERGVRSGSVPTALVRGLAVAVDLAVRERAERAARVAALRDRLLDGVLATVPGAVLRGPDPRVEPGARLPGNLLVTIAGCDSEALLLLLDEAGVAASTGSACRAGVARPSHVLLAMGLSEAEARGAVRLTLGPTTTQDDVDAVLAVLPEVAARARAAAA